MKVAPGLVGAVRFTVSGIVDGEPAIVMEHINRLTDAAAPDWPRAPEGRPGVHRVIIKGSPGVEVNVHVGGPAVSAGGDGVDHNIAGVIATAAKAVNAIPAVCAAPPGLLSLRDLPVAQVPPFFRKATR
jgi:hypothetical protein